MDLQKRHQRIWKLLHILLSGWLKRKFNFTAEIARLEGPCLVIPNHVTAWDPLLVALSFPDNQMYFVASEHIFRWGIVSTLIQWLVSPISRRKGASGADTVMTCIRRIRKGASICLFAEGDSSWDGRTGEIFPATGKLAKACGASLVTYRLEGGYLTKPRWGKGVRRGAMSGHVVGVYSPQHLKTMTADQVNDLIQRDIREDAWARQEAEPVHFRGKAPAEHMECLVYICPACGAVGGLTSHGNQVACRCGFSLTLTDTGSFLPDTPFRNPGEWDDWQKRRLPELTPGEDGCLFRDTKMILREILPGNKSREMGPGLLEQYADRLVCCGACFPMADIEGMSIHNAQVLTVALADRYFEITSKSPRCTRKYLDFFTALTRSAADPGPASGGADRL